MATVNMTLKLIDNVSNNMKKIEQQTSRTERAFKSLDVAAGMLLAKGVEAAMGLVGGFTKLSDQLIQTEARINLMNDGLQTNVELMNMIYESSQRGRMGYMEMADAVSKMGMMAGDAFKSTEQIVQFNEILAKTFTVSGTGAQQIDSAMLQLTQSLGAGRMQGEEFNAVMEASPMIIQSIADYMGVARGEVKSLASDGLVTSDVIVNAMLSAGEDIEKMFSDMPMTAAQKMTEVRNQFVFAFKDIITQFSDILVKGMTVGMEFVMNNFNMLMMALTATGIAFTVMGARAAFAWTMANLPLVATIAGIGLVLLALNSLGLEWGAMAGLAVAALDVVLTGIRNMVAFAYNLFTGLFTSIQNGFAQIAGVFGFDIAVKEYKPMAWKEFNPVETFKNVKSKAGGMSGSMNKALGGGFGGISKGSTGAIPSYGQLGPISGGKLKGGKLDSVGKIDDKISIKEEDLKMLSDIATQGFKVKYQQVTPQLTAYFGDVRETIDIDRALDALGVKFNEYANSNLLLG